MNHFQEPIDSEDGITFIAERSGSNPTITETESVLPWRRCSMVDDSLNRCGGPLKQEFPPWIANKEYVLGYSSPTNTVIRSIDQPSDSKRVAVYDIFTIAEDKGTNDGKSQINMAFIDDENVAKSKKQT